MHTFSEKAFISGNQSTNSESASTIVLHTWTTSLYLLFCLCTSKVWTSIGILLGETYPGLEEESQEMSCLVVTQAD